MKLSNKKLEIPTIEQSLPGREKRMEVPNLHFVNKNLLVPPFPDETELALFGMGCFWGAERKFWEAPGVYSTSVGYAGGHTRNPTYQEVCTGLTGHNEVVRVVFDVNKTDYATLISIFWQSHNPTQGMRQGNDIGTQYRSGIYVYNADQREIALSSRDRFQKSLHESGYGEITTEILDAPKYYYAEGFHQQYLAKNPNGYCGLGGTGVQP